MNNDINSNFNNADGKGKAFFENVLTNPIINPVGWMIDKKKRDAAKQQKDDVRTAELQQQMLGMVQNTNMQTTPNKNNKTLLIVGGVGFFIITAILIFTRKRT